MRVCAVALLLNEMNDIRLTSNHIHNIRSITAPAQTLKLKTHRISSGVMWHVVSSIDITHFMVCPVWIFVRQVFIYTGLCRL